MSAMILLESDIPGCIGKSRFEALHAESIGLTSGSGFIVSATFGYDSIYCNEQDFSPVGSICTQARLFLKKEELQLIGCTTVEVWEWSDGGRKYRQVDTDLYAWKGIEPATKAFIPFDWNPVIESLQYDFFDWSELDKQVVGSGLIVDLVASTINHSNGFQAFTTRDGWVTQYHKKPALEYHHVNNTHRKLHASGATGLRSALTEFIDNYTERV